MLFNSMKFIIFLAVIFGVHWCSPHKYRKWVLFAGSYYFYMSWNPTLIILILGITAVSYWGGALDQSVGAFQMEKEAFNFRDRNMLRRIICIQIF